MELESAQQAEAEAQQAEAEAEGRQAAEANRAAAGGERAAAGGERAAAGGERAAAEGGKALSWQTVAAVAGVAVAAAAVQNWWQERFETIAQNAADVLFKSKVDDVAELSEAVKKGAIVPQPRLAEVLTAHLEKSAYAVVEGPRGTGKTTGVLLALCGKPGVLRVRMTNKDIACVEIAKALRMPNADTMTLTRLEDVLRKTKKAKKGERPIIIAELVRNAKTHNFVHQVGVLKELCADKRLVKVVIVLSDADAAFAMPEDFARQKRIWVNDFNEDDAHIYLDKLGAPQARNELFYEAGTRPMHLLAAAEEGFAQFIALAQEEAQEDIDALVHRRGDVPEASGPAFRRLIIDLLEKTSDGWSPQGFDKGAEKLGLPRQSTLEYLETPKHVADVFKDGCHAVLYHQPSHTYRFHSTSHRRAAEKTFPEGSSERAAAAASV